MFLNTVLGHLCVLCGEGRVQLVPIHSWVVRPFRTPDANPCRLYALGRAPPALQLAFHSLIVFLMKRCFQILIKSNLQNCFYSYCFFWKRQDFDHLLKKGICSRWVLVKLQNKLVSKFWLCFYFCVLLTRLSPAT